MAKENRKTESSDWFTADKAVLRATVSGVLLVVGMLASLWIVGMLGEAPFSDGFGESKAHHYAESMREAQRLSQRAMERTEIANNALLRGNDDYGNVGDDTNPGQGLKLDVDLAKFAAQLNAVGRTKTVTLAAEDLQQPFQECSRLTNRYFPRLRFGARESYSLPTPQSMAVEDSGFDGSIRCERDNATIYLPTAPRNAQNISACWSRQASFSNRSSPGSRAPKLPVWVRMQWDEEATRWTIYTRADQRTVDRQRVTKAQAKLTDDIARKFEQREKHATNDMPGLVAKVKEMRTQLAITANEERQTEISRTLDIYERELKRALLDQRYTFICETAANAALDARTKDR